MLTVAPAPLASGDLGVWDVEVGVDGALCLADTNDRTDSDLDVSATGAVLRNAAVRATAERGLFRTLCARGVLGVNALDGVWTASLPLIL